MAKTIPDLDPNTLRWCEGLLQQEVDEWGGGGTVCAVLICLIAHIQAARARKEQK